MTDSEMRLMVAIGDGFLPLAAPAREVLVHPQSHARKLAAAREFLEDVAPRHPEWRVRRLIP